MSNLKVLRLSNGTDIIGFLEMYTDQEINDCNSELDEPGQPQFKYDHIVFIRHPMKVVSNYNKEAKANEIFLTPWMPLSDDPLFLIPKDQILTICSPMEEIAKYYYELHGEPVQQEITPEMIEEEQQKIYFDFLNGWEVNEDEEEKH